MPSIWSTLTTSTNNQIVGGNAAALAENFKTNARFISGIGADYSENAVNMVEKETNEERRETWVMGEAKPGCLLPPAKVTRYIDSNPIDVQLDIPMLGQFRIYLLMWDVRSGPSCTPSARQSRHLSRWSASSRQQQTPHTPNNRVCLPPKTYTAGRRDTHLSATSSLSH